MFLVAFHMLIIGRFTALALRDATWSRVGDIPGVYFCFGGNRSTAFFTTAVMFLSRLLISLIRS
jgi:hypothetical protein